MISEVIPSTALDQLLQPKIIGKGEVVAISLIMLGEDGPNKAGLVSLNAVIRALRSGLEKDARALAVGGNTSVNNNMKNDFKYIDLFEEMLI